MSPRRHTIVIAEMACSHEGESRLARRIIDAAGRAGAQIIQFQIWQRDRMVVPHHPDYPKLARLELSQETWRELARYVWDEHPSLEIFACVTELKSVEFCESLGVD